MSQDRIDAELARAATDLGLDPAKMAKALGDRVRDHEDDVLVDGEVRVRDHLAQLAQHRPDLRAAFDPADAQPAAIRGAAPRAHAR